jgi:hypothetical protein
MDGHFTALDNGRNLSGMKTNQEYEALDNAMGRILRTDPKDVKECNGIRKQERAAKRERKKEEK